MRGGGTKKCVGYSDNPKFYGGGSERKVFIRKRGSNSYVFITHSVKRRFSVYSSVIAYLKKNSKKVIQGRKVELIILHYRKHGSSSSLEKAVLHSPNQDNQYEESSFTNLDCRVVASTHIFKSEDNNVIVDSELHLTCDGADEDEQEDISFLCVHDSSYFDEFALSIPKGKMNLSDEKTEEHKDHCYIERMSQLQNLDFFHNLDIEMDEESIQGLIEITLFNLDY